MENLTKKTDKWLFEKQATLFGNFSAYLPKSEVEDLKLLLAIEREVALREVIKRDN